MSRSRDIKIIGVWANSINGINDGYGYAGYKLCKTLNGMGIKTHWGDTRAPIALSFLPPHSYGGIKRQFRIGYTPWESTELRKGWADLINSQDLFWTPSDWCASVFRQNHITIPVVTVRHGIDPLEWTLSHREPPEGDFIFFHMGEPTDRKNGQMVFDAFNKCFKGKNNVKLFFKAHKVFRAKWIEDGVTKGPIWRHPQVMEYRALMSINELNRTYHRMHCMVYPSNAEGFGLIPFQAIATGMPTILTNYSGMTEFSKYGIPLDYKVGPSNHQFHLGSWAWPDFDDLCDKMIWVYENYEEASETAFQNAIKMRDEFVWENIISAAILDLKSRL